MTQRDLFQTATSSQLDTHVNHLVKPGSDEARRMTAISGQKYLPLFKQNDPIGLFAKMFMDTSAWGSTKCYLTWKPKVTPANRLLFQLVPSMPRTGEIESGLWATPRTTDVTGGPRKLDEQGRRISQTNPDLKFGANLADQVKMWPTPTTRDYKGKSGTGRQERKGHPTDTLPNAVAMWPTPTANEDSCGTPNGKMQKMLGNHPDVRNTGVGTLNPQWVEWLMGYPEEWTDLKD